MVKVETAHEMLAATLEALPADIAICAAAVADWRAADEAPHKLKKQNQGGETTLKLTQNPDILATVAGPGAKRPRLVIGFAAETENLIANATAKRRAKGADWIVANDVWPGTGAMGGDQTQVHLDHAGRRRGLAADEQGRDGGAAARPRRRGAAVSPLGRGMNDGGRGVSITLRVLRLPHGEGLPLPTYHSEHAAGLDVVAGVPEDAPVAIGARRPRARSHRLRASSSRPGFEAQLRPRSGLALKSGVTLLEQPRHHRRRLSRRGQSAAGQSRV